MCSVPASSALVERQHNVRKLVSSFCCDRTGSDMVNKQVTVVYNSQVALKKLGKQRQSFEQYITDICKTNTLDVETLATLLTFLTLRNELEFASQFFGL